MDHFAGFDQLLRILLGRERTLRLYGPEGLIDAVGHKLAAYTWNLVAGYATDLTLQVTEVAPGPELRRAEFHCRAGFRPEGEHVESWAGDRLLDEASFCVRATILDHGIPCLAFALEERARVNIWKNRVEDLGLRVGPWLRELKAAILRDDPDDTPIHAHWKEERETKEAVLPLGQLREKVATLTDGAKIVYVVDATPSDENTERILKLAHGATILFIEAAFLDEDAERAHARHHLTARLAGDIARRAGAQRLATMHYSPRYEGRGQDLAREAETAFRAVED
jgi:ribonuclease Z